MVRQLVYRKENLWIKFLKEQWAKYRSYVKTDSAASCGFLLIFLLEMS